MEGSGEEQDSAYVDSFFLPGGILDDSELDDADKNTVEGSQRSLLEDLYSSSTVIPSLSLIPPAPVSQNPWDPSGSGDLSDAFASNSADMPSLLTISSDTSQAPSTSWLRPATVQSPTRERSLLTGQQIMSDGSSRASSIPPPPGLVAVLPPPPGFETSSAVPNHQQQWRKVPARSQDQIDNTTVVSQSERRTGSRSFDDVDASDSRVIRGNTEGISLLTGVSSPIGSLSNTERNHNVPSDRSNTTPPPRGNRFNDNNSSFDSLASTPVSAASTKISKRNDGNRDTKLSQQQRQSVTTQQQKSASVVDQATLHDDVSMNDEHESSTRTHKTLTDQSSFATTTYPQRATEYVSSHQLVHAPHRDDDDDDKLVATTSTNHHNRRKRRKNPSDPSSQAQNIMRGESADDDEPSSAMRSVRKIAEQPPRQESSLLQVAIDTCSTWLFNLFGAPLSRALGWLSDFYKLIINPMVLASGQYLFYVLVLVAKFVTIFASAFGYMVKFAFEEAMVAYYLYDYFNLMPPALQGARPPSTSLLCYLVFYLTPFVCDWLMNIMFLPHYFPHTLSSLALYFVCLRLTQHSLRERKMLRRRSRSDDGSYSWQSSQSFSETDRRRLGNDLSHAVLRSIRLAVPCCFVVEGFSRTNSSYMLLETSARLVLAYSLSLTRSGLLLSPVAWIGWSVQVLLAAYFPAGNFLDNMLFFIGMAFLRLASTLQSDRAITI